MSQTYYYVDYENLHDSAFGNIELLPKNDKIFILTTSKLSAYLLKRIQKCRCSVECISVKNGMHDALDFQLVTYLLLQATSKRKIHYVIVSKDRGYDYAIDIIKENGIHIERKTLINCEPVRQKDSIKQFIYSILYQCGVARVNEIRYERIVKAVKDADDISELEASLKNAMGATQGARVYEHIKDEYSNLSNLVDKLK